MPLSNTAIAIILKQCTQGSDILKKQYVFDTCYDEVRSNWLKLRKLLPSHLGHLNIHDLRQTHIFWVGHKDFLLIQHSLAHKVGGASGHYVGSGATFDIRKQKIDELDEKLLSKK